MRPIDISKFQKSALKNVDGISAGFSNPDTWIHTGNYALNFRVSGDFYKGFPLEGKMTLLAGDSGTGKSYIAIGNIAKWCQDNNVLPLIIDTENALDRDWVEAFNFDPDGYCLYYRASILDKIAGIMSDFIEGYKKEYSDMPYNERPKVLIIIDSLGMAITPTEQKQFEDGDMKGDLGRKQKQIYSICRNFMASCGAEPIGMLCTQHTYASQDLFNPDAVIAGGKGLEFTPSIVIAMSKNKLKEDEDGKKTTDVKGIKVRATVRKTRYTQPFQDVKFNIPWDSGMDPYSGLFELFAEQLMFKGKYILSKEGSWVAYYSLQTGEQIFKKYRKDITNEDYDMIMKDYVNATSSTLLVTEEGNKE
nr:MAG TPA: Recombination and repair protein [Caudoviricetes sp.]